MFEHHPYPVALLAADGTVLRTNLVLDQLLGPGVEVIGMRVEDYVAVDQAKRFAAALASATRLEDVSDILLAIGFPGCSPIEAMATLVPADSTDGGVFVELRVSRGIVDASPSREPIGWDKERTPPSYAAMLDSLHVPVALLDAAGRITAVNEAWRHFGREKGTDGASFGVGEDYRAMWRRAADVSAEAAAMLAVLQEVLSGNRSTFELESGCHCHCHGAEHRWFRVYGSAVRPPFEPGAVVMHVEVTERHRAGERTKRAVQNLRQLSKAAVAAEREYRHWLSHAVQQDALTGLANRSVLERAARNAIACGAGKAGVYALMLIDLDRFHLLNESLGYARGDGLLTEVAARLRVAVPSGELVARLAADEFAILFAGLPDAAAARDHANQIREQLRFAVGSATGPLEMTASIGYSCSPASATDFDELLRNAGFALQEAKKHGAGSVRAYESRMRAPGGDRLRLQSELAEAIETEQFVLFYQPIVDILSGQPRSVEALLRWRHRKHGLLTPDKFVGPAEESGAIIELGDWVLQRACADAVRLREKVGHPIRVAVNLSARQFDRSDLGTRVRRALEAAGLEPASLRLELTETMVMADPDTSSLILGELAAIGIGLALDDFGTGYSSLGYLQRFPLTCLKIDRSFVSGLPDNERATAITRSVVFLAKALRMDVVAEGVETDAQLEFLQTLGCDALQGYLLARPMPYEQALEWIAARMALMANGMP